MHNGLVDESRQPMQLFFTSPSVARTALRVALGGGGGGTGGDWGKMAYRSVKPAYRVSLCISHTFLHLTSGQATLQSSAATTEVHVSKLLDMGLETGLQLTIRKTQYFLRIHQVAVHALCSTGDRKCSYNTFRV